MKRYCSGKYSVALLVCLLLAACHTIPEWDKEIIDNPVEDGRCPDISGQFTYYHIKWTGGVELYSILNEDLPNNLPADRAAPADYKPGFLKRGTELIPIPFPAPNDFYPGHYGATTIYGKIHKGITPYQGTFTVMLSRLDQSGRKYHVRVDWDKQGLLGEYDFKFNDMWVCSGNKFIRVAKSTLYEDYAPEEVDPRDYRRIYVLPNGNIQIDRKHTYIYRPDKNNFVRYYVSLVFAKIP